MRYLFLILACFMMSGCITTTHAKSLMYDSYVAGYREGRTDGVDLGKSFGYFDGIKDCTDIIIMKRSE